MINRWIAEDTTWYVAFGTNVPSYPAAVDCTAKSCARVAKPPDAPLGYVSPVGSQ